MLPRASSRHCAIVRMNAKSHCARLGHALGRRINVAITLRASLSAPEIRGRENYKTVMSLARELAAS